MEDVVAVRTGIHSEHRGFLFESRYRYTLCLLFFMLLPVARFTMKKKHSESSVKWKRDRGLLRCDVLQFSDGC